MGTCQAILTDCKGIIDMVPWNSYIGLNFFWIIYIAYNYATITSLRYAVQADCWTSAKENEFTSKSLTSVSESFHHQERSRN